MATKMPQAPQNKLQQIICDADLYYLGTDTYLSKSNKLYKELHESGIVKEPRAMEEHRNKIFTIATLFY